MREEIIGAATLYLGDCREVLPTLGVDERTVRRERKAMTPARHRGVMLKPNDPGAGTFDHWGADRQATRLLGEAVDKLIARGHVL